MKIIITEDQKKKLFIPRRVDERDAELLKSINSFLVKIKDSLLWDIVSEILVIYTIPIDHVNVILSLKSSTEKFDEFSIDFKITEFFSKQNNGNSDELSKKIIEEKTKIIDFMASILPSGDDFYECVSSLNKLNTGELLYSEDNVILVTKENVRVIKV